MTKLKKKSGTKLKKKMTKLENSNCDKTLLKLWHNSQIVTVTVLVIVTCFSKNRHLNNRGDFVRAAFAILAMFFLSPHQLPDLPHPHPPPGFGDPFFSSTPSTTTTTISSRSVPIRPRPRPTTTVVTAFFVLYCPILSDLVNSLY